MQFYYDENINDFVGFAEEKILSVTEVEAFEDYTLLLSFSNGEKKIYDAVPLLEKPVFNKLKNITCFLGAHVAFGAVSWDDETDIATEHLYECGVPLKGTAND